jgi:citrate synthase
MQDIAANEDKDRSGSHQRPSNVGLEGVVAAETRSSHVDGQAGELRFVGQPVEQLATQESFESAAALLLEGRAPSEGEVTELQERLAEGRAAAFERLPELGGALHQPNVMDALRAGLAQLPATEEPAALIGATAALVGAWNRARCGAWPISPRADRSHAADLFRMIQGEAPSAAQERALETYLITVLDHGMNASTFAARVVASTGSDSVSAVVAAVGALKGPLHGGAPGPVLDMLDAIERPEAARAWLEAEVAAGRRIMGMGHRVYRLRDPRARVLEGALSRLERDGVAGDRLTLARAVEREAEALLRERHPDRPLHANVEFYTATLLEALGIHRSVFTGVFASARVVGWLAHVAEQRSSGRLIRPLARYVGP